MTLVGSLSPDAGGVPTPTRCTPITTNASARAASTKRRS